MTHLLKLKLLKLSSQPGMMVVLPPPAKATDRKKPSKPAPPSITAPTSSTVRPSASMSSNVFDPFFHSSGNLTACYPSNFIKHTGQFSDFDEA